MGTAKAKLCGLKRIWQSPQGYKTAGALHFQVVILFLACRFRQHISSLSRNIWSYFAYKRCCDLWGEGECETSTSDRQFERSAASAEEACNVRGATRDNHVDNWMGEKEEEEFEPSVRTAALRSVPKQGRCTRTSTEWR